MKKGLMGLGHRLFPWLAEPYRRVKFTTTGLLQFPREIKEALRGRDCDFLPGSEDYRLYTQWYTGKCAAAAENKNVAEGIIWMGDGRLYHGGPTDRLRGILSTYYEAKRRNLPFYINWTDPFDLTDYLVPSAEGPDWRIDGERISYKRSESFPTVIMESRFPQAHIVNSLRLLNSLKNKRKQHHIYSNADNAKGNYSALFKELFKPSAQLAKSVDYHLKGISAKYWAFTFRFRNLLGDFADHYDLQLSEEEAEKLMVKVESEFRELTRHLPEGYRILVTSDSVRFLKYIAGRDERVYIVKGDVKNIDMDKGMHTGAWLKTFTDQQLLMRAEKVWLMQTGDMYPSGFPGFAAEIGNKPFVHHKF